MERRTSCVPWLLVLLEGWQENDVPQARVPGWRLRVLLDGLEDVPSALPPHRIARHPRHDVDRLKGLSGTHNKDSLQRLVRIPEWSLSKEPLTSGRKK